MQFYSIFLAAVALMVSTASAADEHWQKADVDCLNLCHEQPNGFTCPPETEKSQLPNVCSTNDHLFHRYKRLTCMRFRAAGPAATLSKRGKDKEKMVYIYDGLNDRGSLSICDGNALFFHLGAGCSII